jgi:hypothetical protein
MPPEVLVLIFGILFAISGSILIGYRMYYRHMERLNSGGSDEDVGELREAVADLQEEVHALQKNAAGFDERLEFTERLLAKPRDDRASTD